MKSNLSQLYSSKQTFTITQTTDGRTSHLNIDVTTSELFCLQPTPANEHVDGEADGGVVDDEQQRVQVETLHQQPEKVGHDEVVKEYQDGLAAHLTHTHTEVMDVILFLLRLIQSKSPCYYDNIPATS